MSAPNASERKACWGARDQLWKCLDEFEAMCPAQWVSPYYTRAIGQLSHLGKKQTITIQSGSRNSKNNVWLCPKCIPELLLSFFN
uniref:Cytochrome c oxidase assembly factor 6 homolog n=1 Tax=Sinocyclocheilus rhinocerous TaxID=307959 RepID=A0A673IDH8_9TELE